jgi:hypothetical protein
MEEQQKNSFIHWKTFFFELWDKMSQLWYQPPAVFYFLGIILLVGGIGIWASIYSVCIVKSELREWIVVSHAMSIYFIAIIATSSSDLLLSEKKAPSWQMFAIFVLIIAIVLAILCYLTSTKISFIFSSIGITLALFSWFIANADNIKLLEPSPPPIDAAGGNIDKGLEGNLNGIEV